MSDFRVYTLRNTPGTEMVVTNYGCTVMSLRVPDRSGALADVVLGFSNPERYPIDSPHFGCVVGRFGNRIAHGRFSLDGKEYRLRCNNSPAGVDCHLHGGPLGFDKAFWNTEPVTRTGATGLRFSRLSPDGEEGYPGNLELEMTYWLTDANEFQIEYRAHTDQATPINLTHHSYFNLRGEGSGDILDHWIQIYSDAFVAVGNDLIPSGILQAVQGTALDFRDPHRIGERIQQEEEALLVARGYDHCWVLGQGPQSLRPAAFVTEPQSGRTLEVLTTEPGIQFYSGNFLDGSLCGKSGEPYGFRSGFCLEPQHFPDSPNQPAFPTTILRPGQEYVSQTVYRFGVLND